jgi:hypothetical protein
MLFKEAVIDSAKGECSTRREPFCSEIPQELAPAHMGQTE